MNAQNTELIIEGIRIEQQIRDFAGSFEEKRVPIKYVSISYISFFRLMEYTAIMNKGDLSLEFVLTGLINSEQLFFETGKSHLKIVINWFPEPGEEIKII